MADLSSLTADQLAEKVRGYASFDVGLGEPYLAELQTRANQYDRWNAAGALTVTALGERVQAAEKERDEARETLEETAVSCRAERDTRKAAEARLAETQEALRRIADGNWNFGNERPGLTVMDFARAALTTHPAEAGDG